MKTIVICICFYVFKEVCVSLKITDSNVCPRTAVAKRNPLKSKGNPTLDCCPNYSLQNGTCQECHQGFYNTSYNFNCSGTCICRNETFCNPRSGICECGDETLCNNIWKKTTTKNPTDRQSVQVITLVNFSAVCMPMLLFTFFLLINHCKHQYQHSPRDIEAISDKTYGNGIYCEINDEQPQDQTSVILNHF